MSVNHRFVSTSALLCRIDAIDKTLAIVIGDASESLRREREQIKATLNARLVGRQEMREQVALLKGCN